MPFFKKICVAFIIHKGYLFYQFPNASKVLYIYTQEKLMPKDNTQTKRHCLCGIFVNEELQEGCLERKRRK